MNKFWKDNKKEVKMMIGSSTLSFMDSMGVLKKFLDENLPCHRFYCLRKNSGSQTGMKSSRGIDRGLLFLK